MSALIDMSNGQANIAYTGEKPWHGLGADMGDSQDMNEWRKRAGLNWEALSTPSEYIVPGVGMLQVEGRKVLYRSDNNNALAVVSDRYQPFQPAEVMDFYENLCRTHGFLMETAGSLKDGKVIWALAKTGESTRIRGNDPVNGYVLLSTSFDGSMATTARHTSVRVVCNNTLTVANCGRPAISIRHNTKVNPDAVRAALGIGEAWDAFADQAARMAETKVSPEQGVAFFLQVYHNMADIGQASEAQKKSAERTMRRLADQLYHAPGAALPSADGTVWGLVNAVTHDIDFKRRASSQGNRLASAWYGSGEATKNRAWDEALKLAA